MRNFKNYKKLAATAIFATACLSFDGSQAQASILPIITSNPNNTFIQMIGKWFDAFLNTKNTQAVVDAQDKAVHDKSQLELVPKYTIDNDPATGLPLYKGCYTGLSSSAGAAAKDGINNFSAKVDAGSDAKGQTPAAKLSDACQWGYLYPGEYPALAGANGVIKNCKPATDTSRINNDVNFAVRNIDNMMQIPTGPKGLKINNGVFIWPKPGDVSDPHQLAYIDAMKMCANLRAIAPASMAGALDANGNLIGTAPTGVSVLGTFAQRQGEFYKSAAFHDCVAEVNRNTAISSAAQSISPDFQTLYTVQYNQCQALQALGIRDPALTDCQTNGLSLAKAEEIEKTRFAPPGAPPANSNGPSEDSYIGYLMGLGMDKKELAIETDRHMDMQLLLDALRDVSASNQAIAANTMPRVSEPGPSALDKQISEQHEDIMKLTAMVKELIAVNQTLAENAASKKTTEKHLTALEQQFAVTAPMQTRVQAQ